MNKKYIVALTDSEREECKLITDRLVFSSQKAQRALILLQVDINGPGWTDQQTADAYHCTARTVANTRKRLVQHGLKRCLNKVPSARCPRSLLLDGRQEAKVIALRLGSPPKGFSNWSLRLLAARVVALQIAPEISHETCRSVLKKMA